jgi:hypothetical protein
MVEMRRECKSGKFPFVGQLANNGDQSLTTFLVIALENPSLTHWAQEMHTWPGIAGDEIHVFVLVRVLG